MVFKAEDIKLRKTVFSERWEIKCLKPSYS